MAAVDKPTKGDDFPVTGGVPLPESMVHKPTKLSEEEITKLVAQVATKCALRGNWLGSKQEKLCEQLGILQAALSAKDAELERQAKRIKELEEAMQPFADEWNRWLRGNVGQHPFYGPEQIEAFRRAAKALETKDGNDGKTK